MGRFVGIDLGTTNSAIAIINEAGKPEIVNNSDGEATTPSVIYFGPDPVIGDEAKELQLIGEVNIASFFKRSMGDPNFVLDFYGKKYTPVDLSCLILKKLKGDAEKRLGEVITDAVITVPAYFNDLERCNTIKAGESAGFNVLRIINEPTSAALAYGLHECEEEQLLLVYDLGGGTFDVTLVRISNQDIVVLATEGDHNLGGKDWDDRIVLYLGEQFTELYGVNPLDDDMAFGDLLVKAENGKKELSSRSSASFSMHYQGNKATFKLTRDKFNELTSDLMERTTKLAEHVVQGAGMDWSDINGIILVGGSTKMPMVHEYVKKISGKVPMAGINVDEAVALGAAIQAAMDCKSSSPVFLLSGEKCVQDVMSHSLGKVALNQDQSKYINSIIIPKNGKIPCREHRDFQLRTKNNLQNKLEVYMTQGESERPKECAILGKYVFNDVSYTNGGLTVVDVCYEYDKNGVVNVFAAEKSTGKKLPMKIEPVPANMGWLDLPPEKQVDICHVSIYLCIDVSSSMSGNPLMEAQKAARGFVDKCDLANMSVGLISFGGYGKMRLECCQNAKSIINAINGLYVSGSTDMTDGINIGYNALKDLKGPRFIILLTDGSPDNQTSAETAAKACRGAGIGIVTIGTGGADFNYLRRLATSDESNIFSKLGNLVATFGHIAQVLTETGGGMQINDNGEVQKMGKLSFINK